MSASPSVATAPVAPPSGAVNRLGQYVASRGWRLYLLGVAIAAVRGTWHVIIAFGEPIVVPQDRHGDKTSTLTRQLEDRVQRLLNELTG